MGGISGLLGNFFGGTRGLDTDPDPKDEVGTTAHYVSGGFLVENERNTTLRGRQKWLTYSDLLANVAIVGAGVRAYLNLLSRSKWTVKPADTETEADAVTAQEVADFVWDVLNDLERPWSRVVRRSGMSRFHGFDVSEWIAKQRDDGKIGLFDVASRPQSTIYRWDLDPHGRVLGVTQRNPKNSIEVYLPRAKIVYIVEDAMSDSPEGMGLFRHLSDANQRLQQYQILEAFGFDSDLRGTPIGRAPYGKLAKDKSLSEAQRKKATSTFETFVANHIVTPERGIILDSGPYRDLGESQSPAATPEWDLKILQGSSTSAGDVAKAIERLTRDMAIVLGVQGLLLGGDGSGSLALGRAFSDQFALMVDSGLRELAEAFEHDLVPPIISLNGIDERFTPTLATELAQHRDVEQITQSVLDLSQAGAPLTTADPVVDEIREMLGLSPVPAELVEDIDQDDPPLRPGEPDPVVPEPVPPELEPEPEA